jgi:hypothetical protein
MKICSFLPPFRVDSKKSSMANHLITIIYRKSYNLSENSPEFFGIKFATLNNVIFFIFCYFFVTPNFDIFKTKRANLVNPDAVCLPCFNSAQKVCVEEIPP